MPSPLLEVILLRAALVFTSSGLDATCQALVQDCAPRLIRKGGNARVRFDLFLDEQVAGATRALKVAVKDPDPRSALIQLYIDSKTRASLQGTGDITKRVRDVLGMTNQALPTAQIDALQGFFIARNSIVHALDYRAPDSRSTARWHRAPSDVVDECNRVLALLAALIHATAKLL